MLLCAAPVRKIMLPHFMQTLVFPIISNAFLKIPGHLDISLSSFSLGSPLYIFSLDMKTDMINDFKQIFFPYKAKISKCLTRVYEVVHIERHR